MLNLVKVIKKILSAWTCPDCHFNNQDSYDSCAGCGRSK